MDALHDYFISRPQLRELYDLLEQVGYIYLIGGVLREYKDHECIINLRDIDITIDVQSEQKWQNFCKTIMLKLTDSVELKILIDDTED